jgi:imidazolonepropionase-like amidohydrolase
MCLREGLAPAAAWRALCADSAAIARLEGSVGRLERGLDADLVLWSGDPLALSSRVVAVWIDGVRVEEPKR